MNYTVLGLFPGQEFAKEIFASLEQSGFENRDYIMHKTPYKKEEAKTPISQSLITSVYARNEDELATINRFFEKNEVVKIYEFQDMTLEDAKNLDYVKRIVALRAESQIYAMPAFTMNKITMSEGISTEVRA
ncbi:hypothetical protein [Chryseobacterium sp. MP_3.2]|uniref:hypothetical protein n=1 Tax=Chryseobacterium sp. MP_3.2 TaxID=3071712 RepID=UPI002E04FA5D|nr:hypothetical protein [Chryseobacterium sp. MP_3.2]